MKISELMIKERKMERSGYIVSRGTQSHPILKSLCGVARGVKEDVNG